MTPESSAPPQHRKLASALRPLALAAASLVLAACGGGGGGGGGAPAPVLPQSISGVVVDGYIVGATVSCLKAGTSVATTTSDSTGKYAFALAAGQSCDTVQSVGGIDVGITPGDPADDIPAPAGAIRAPVPTGSASVANLVISPLTTLVQTLIASGASADTAQTQVRTALGLPAGLDLLRTDPAGDAALYKATVLVGQLVGQVANALAAVGGIEDAARRQALAAAANQALAARMSSLNVAALVQTPDALTPGSPLFGVIEQAATNAKGGSAGSALASLNPSAFAAMAAPMVAAATRSVYDATSVADAVARANAIVDRDRAATVLGALASLATKAPANTQETQGVLDALAAALAAADGSGTDHSVPITVGGTTVSAVVAGTLSNYALLAGDQVVLQAPLGSTTAKLADFEGGAGVAVPDELVGIGFTLQKSAVNAQFPAGATHEVSLALQVTDATRTFQAIVDKVEISVDAGKVVARLLTGARLWVYGKTATSETTSPLIVQLAGNGLQIVSNSAGANSFSFDRLFETIGSAAAPGSALDVLATSRVKSGSYDVIMAIGTLRVARAASPTDPTPVLAGLHAVSLRAGGQSVIGYGFRGKVLVTP